MNENQTTDVTLENDGFEDFAAAFDDDSGYQTETDTEEATSEPEEPAQDPTEPAETEDPDDSASIETQEEQPAQEPASDPEKPASEQKHTIKHNKGTEEVTYQELIARAQMGTDYPRVKEQRDQARQEVQTLQAEMVQHKETMDFVSMIAEKSEMSPVEMLENLYISMQMSNGVDEATARANLRADKLQRQVSAMEEASRQKQTAQEDEANRAKREIEEFRKSYPDVVLGEDLVDKLMPDVHGGKTITEAYRKYESAQKDAQIAELQRQLEAEKQNKKNRSASPGSQVDSGGRREKSDFDDFVSALFD